LQKIGKPQVRTLLLIPKAPFLASPFPESCESQKLGISILHDFCELQKSGKLRFPILASVPDRENRGIIRKSNFCDRSSGGHQMSPFSPRVLPVSVRQQQTLSLQPCLPVWHLLMSWEKV
jgi:hypothetical protein